MSRGARTRSLPPGRAARPVRQAGGADGEYAPGAIELARRVVAVVGGRHFAEPGGLVRVDLAHGRAMACRPGGQAWTAPG